MLHISSWCFFFFFGFLVRNPPVRRKVRQSVCVISHGSIFWFEIAPILSKRDLRRWSYAVQWSRTCASSSTRRPGQNRQRRSLWGTIGFSYLPVCTKRSSHIRAWNQLRTPISRTAPFRSPKSPKEETNEKLCVLCVLNPASRSLRAFALLSSENSLTKTAFCMENNGSRLGFYSPICMMLTKWNFYHAFSC